MRFPTFPPHSRRFGWSLRPAGQQRPGFSRHPQWAETGCACHTTPAPSPRRRIRTWEWFPRPEYGRQWKYRCRTRTGPGDAGGSGRKFCGFLALPWKIRQHFSHISRTEQRQQAKYASENHFRFLLTYCFRTARGSPPADSGGSPWHRCVQNQSRFLQAYRHPFQTTAETVP